MADIFDKRRDYMHGELFKSSVLKSPFDQFNLWLEEAIANEAVDEAHAMTVATVGTDGRPSARVVLSRAVDVNGFSFFTNYESRKGSEIGESSPVALLFYWGALERQVRIEGIASRLDATESDSYWNTRPHKSKISAIASGKQSAVVSSRAELENRFNGVSERYPIDAGLPRPQNWGGYIVKPEVFEFWQGRRSRLHDRIRYRSFNNNNWEIDRLAP